MKTKIALAGLGLAMALSGCHSIGPGSVARDRFDYSSSLGESWKRQTLLNIVKLRYLDPPIFVDVGQIVSGYTLQTTASAGGGVNWPSAGTAAGSLALGAQGQYTDRPTVTYTPLTGNKFIKGLMTPLPPDSVFFTIQSGWPADGVLFATVSEINGLKNQGTSVSGVTPPDPGFMRVLQLMRKIQLSGAVAMRIRQDSASQETTLLTFRSKDISPETLADIHELRQLLRLDPDAEDIKLVFGSNPTNDREVAMITRSMMQQMATMASQVEVPAEDVSQGRATPGWETMTNGVSAPRLLKVYSSKDAPKDAFVAIPYRNSWYWIDDRDLKSKRTFSFMMLLFTLADTGEKEPLPLVTIPAQ
ncbi:MAG TPA: hypothetical protein VNN22_21205 [Verrucomicrobiae bacterium]|nr:hypothetical protein [Verrucomicrobiae bacterium]